MSTFNHVSFIFASSLIPLTSFGNEKAQSLSPYSPGEMAFNVIVALGLVTGLIFLLAYITKRIGGTNLLQQGGLKITANVPIGTREKLLIVEIEDKKLLLGVAQGNIRCLHVFDKDEHVNVPNIDEEKVEPIGNRDFASYLKTMITDGIRK